MRVLHLVKTSDGAAWAAYQAHELTRLGVEVHVALPSREGRTMPLWEKTAAEIHVATLDFPARKPWQLPSRCESLRRLVSRVRPDVIHSHFFGTTLVMRHALGNRDGVPRLFQVPGPLHLEHPLFRRWELSTAGSPDWWVASSACIERLYRAAGVPAARLFRSYYGMPLERIGTTRTGALRRRLGISDDALVVGNMNLMYPPKWYLGHRKGLKRHEDVIDAVGLAARKDERVFGVLIGGQFPRGRWYERELAARARAAAGDRIRMVGFLPETEVEALCPDFDAVLHVPLSENCGGVLVPMAAGVPVVASRVGGLPEVVIEDVTGVTVAPRRPDCLADAILDLSADLPRHRELARRGRGLVTTMFDVRRTASEIDAVYRHVVDPTRPRPEPFDSHAFVARATAAVPTQG